MMRIAQISFFMDPEHREPQRLMRDWPTMVDVAEAAAGGGAQVCVIQASSHRQTLTRGNVTYHFLPPGRYASSIARGATLRRLLRELQFDLLHVHGLGFPRDVLALASVAHGVPILLQDHADQPPRLWRRPLWRQCLATAAGVCFSARDQAAPFQRAGLIGPATAIYEVPEGTCHFAPGDQAQARIATGLHGDPCVLWVGHLNDNKDPLTVLDGVSAAVERLPGLRLWCYFASAPLLQQVQQRIDQDRRLSACVRLMGQSPREHIQQAMRSADLFVLGSHRESCGYALIEAVACGVAPVVTDIPAFRALTGDASVGALWRCGDARSLCEALLSTSASVNPDLRRRVRAHFERELSVEAVGRKLTAIYRQVLEQHAGPLQ